MKVSSMKVSVKRIVKQLILTSMAGMTFTLFSGTELFIPSGQQAVAAEQSQVRERPRRRTPTMRQSAFKKLERAQAAMELKDYPAVLDALEDLRGMRNINSYEEANMWNFYAFYYFELNDTARAIQSFERILGLEGVPIQFEDQIRYQLAQLYFSEENYTKALDLLNEWFSYAAEPTAAAYVFRGTINYVNEDYDAALPDIIKGIELIESAGLMPKENWYLILRVIYYEQQNYAEVRDILEILVINYSKPSYWLQLAAIYGELRDEASQLATMEAAYKQGFLVEESYLINMAQLYMYNSVPIKASVVMQKGIEDGIIEETYKHLELYANSLINAQEFEDSIPPLIKAAGLAESGELSIRLGQVYMERDNWPKSTAAIMQGIEKGDLRREDQAYLLLGMAYYNYDKLEKAKEAFQEAKKDTRSRAQSAQWLKHLDNEINRRTQLALNAQ